MLSEKHFKLIRRTKVIVCKTKEHWIIVDDPKRYFLSSKLHLFETLCNFECRMCLMPTSCIHKHYEIKRSDTRNKIISWTQSGGPKRSGAHIQHPSTVSLNLLNIVTKSSFKAGPSKTISGWRSCSPESKVCAGVTCFKTHTLPSFLYLYLVTINTWWL